MKGYLNICFIIFSMIFVSIFYDCNNKTDKTENEGENEEYLRPNENEKNDKLITEKFMEIAERHEEEDGFIWYSYDLENGKKGIVNPDLNKFTEAKYDRIYYSNVSNSDIKMFYLYKDNGLKDIATLDGTVKVEDVELCRMGFDHWDMLRNVRYWFEVGRKQDGKWMYGAYDKNWDLICPPIFEEVDYVMRKWGDVEYFTAKLDKESDFKIILNYQMGENGNLIEKEKPKYVNYYVVNWFGGSESVMPIMFYDNYMVFDYAKRCPYYRTTGDYDVYKYKPGTNDTNNVYLIYVDGNYNIHLEQIEGEPSPLMDVQWEQMFNRNGVPIYEVILQEAMEKQKNILNS